MTNLVISEPFLADETYSILTGEWQNEYSHVATGIFLTTNHTRV